MYLIVLVAILSEGITTCHCGAIVGNRVEGSHACGSKTSTQNSMRQGTTAELGNTCPHICMHLHTLGEKTLTPLPSMV
jgi:hypothetical protein